MCLIRLHLSLIRLHSSALVSHLSSLVFTRLHSSLISLHSSRHSSVILVIKNTELWAVKNIPPLDFANYLSYSEVQKKMKVVNVWIRFQEVESSKSVTKTLYGKFLISEGSFKLVCHSENCRWSEICCKGNWWKIFEQIVTVAYLKKQPPEVFCKKGALKNFAYFTGKQLCWNLFLIKLQAWGSVTFLKRDSNTGVSPVKFAKLLRKKYLWTSASLSSQAILFTIHEKDTANEA